MFTKGGQPEGPGRTTIQSLRRDSLRREAGGEPRAARSGCDRSLPDPLADPAERDRGGLVDAGRAEGAGSRPPHRRLQLQRRAAAADPADRSRRDAAAAVLAGRARGRGGDPPLRRARGDRRDRLLADGLGPAHRGDDARAGRAAARGRLAQAQRALPGAAALASTSRWSTGCGQVADRHGTTPGSGRGRVDAAKPGGRRRYHRLPPPRPGRPDHRRGTSSSSATRTSPPSKGGRDMATDTATPTRIGFVGLGHMGGNMAARFLAAGYPVYGEKRSRAHAQGLDATTACSGATRRARSPRPPSPLHLGARRRRARHGRHPGPTASSPVSPRIRSGST